ncbi:manganese efflux pump [Cohnella sp. AR92]|uniref:manganese efflux pump MntP n=1 Tax=Cohnella sp. AR92 TaxID=648716 RepID=UPI000F8DB772|nr:manganese efflux pump [Cohnella sp. AR92]RUS45797.1 hypothetical protein ELR57_18245 [Cohnella sp. AR92]
METLFAWILTLSLGLDTLIVSASIGLRDNWKEKKKIALVFAAAESLMPIAGIIIGSAFGRFFNEAISIIGALLLIGVAIYFLIWDKDDEESRVLSQPLSGWPLAVAAIGISLDELAVGFSAGLLEMPIALTVLFIAVQSFAFAMIGVTFGAKLKPFLGEWAEKASGIILGLMGVWMLLESLGLG